MAITARDRRPMGTPKTLEMIKKTASNIVMSGPLSELYLARTSFRPTPDYFIMIKSARSTWIVIPQQT
jgi:hypothetical protein